MALTGEVGGELHPEGRARLTLRDIEVLTFDADEEQGTKAGKAWLWVFDSNRKDEFGNALVLKIKAGPGFGHDAQPLTMLMAALYPGTLTEERVNGTDGKPKFDFEQFKGWTWDCDVFYRTPKYGTKQFKKREMLKNAVRVKDPARTPFVEPEGDPMAEEKDPFAEE